MDKNLKEIENLCDEIEGQIVCVNSGGCCIVAVLLATHLSKHYPTRIRVGSAYNDVVNINDVASNIKKRGRVASWNDNDVYFGHVIVEIEYNGKTYHIDSTGVHKAKKKDPAFGFRLYPGDLSIKDAIQLADDKDGWNSFFDRDQIPLLKKIINRFFKSYCPTFG